MLVSRRGMLLGGAALLAAPAVVRAQEWAPSRNIRFVVPFAAGGSADLVARVLQPQLQARLGQTVIVDNRPGAAGNIGMGEVASSAPDGHTWALAPTNTLATNQFLFRNMGFDPAQAFAPVSLLCVLHNILAVSRATGASTLAEFLAWARANSGRMSYGSGGVGTQAHLAAELLRRTVGFEATHVAYRNSTEPMNDMVRGDVAFMIVQEIAARPFLAGDRVRAIGTAALQRSESLPQLPTLHEQGLSGFEARSWFALVAPARTPDPVVARLNSVVREVLALPDVKTALAAQGVETAGGTAAELQSLVTAEIAKWGRVIREADIRAE